MLGHAGASPSARYDSRDTGSVAEPEARLAELARSAGPLRRVLAALAERLVARRGWERLDYARVGDYARERLGVSGRSLQDWARVGRALDGLPELEAALLSGALPWSKVRLLARFLTPADEASWIAYARSRSVRALESELRAVDRGSVEAGALAPEGSGTGECAAEALGTDGEGEGPVERLGLGVAPALAFKWHRFREVASRVAGGRLTAGAALEMATAETLSALPTPCAEPSGDEASGQGGVRAGEVVAPRNGEALPGSEAPRAQAHGCGGRGAWGGDREATSLGDRAVSDPAAVASKDRPGRVPHACALPAFLRGLVEGLSETDAFDLDARLRRAVRLEQRLDAEIGPLLHQVSAAEYTWRERYATLADYAREGLGLSPRKARALVRLERVGDVCPALRRAYRDGELSWVQAQTLAALLARDAEGAWREAWVAFAASVTVQGLEAAVARARVLREADPAAWARCREEPERVVALMEAEARAEAEAGVAAGSGGAGEWPMCARPTGSVGAQPRRGEAERQVCARPTAGEATWRIGITVPAEVARLFRAAHCSVRRAMEREMGRLPTAAEGFEAMLDHALRSWDVDDRWLRRRMGRAYRVFARDGWRCTVPGCTSRRNLQAHHVVFRSAGGGDEAENLTSLCAFHHQRGVHAGTLRIRGRAPDGLVFELGVRPGRPPLVRYRSGGRVA